MTRRASPFGHVSQQSYADDATIIDATVDPDLHVDAVAVMIQDGIAMHRAEHLAISVSTNQRTQCSYISLDLTARDSGTFVALTPATARMLAHNLVKVADSLESAARTAADAAIAAAQQGIGK